MSKVTSGAGRKGWAVLCVPTTKRELKQAVLRVVLCAESVWVYLPLLCCTVSILHASNKLCVSWEVEEGEA